MTEPRIAPGTREEIGRVNDLITRVIGLASGGGPPNVFTTIARHRGLFRPWLRFAGALMPGGKLPRTDSEMVILRVAHNSRCEYEWQHHERLGQAAGLSAADVARVKEGSEAPGWSERQRLILRAVDELRDDRELSDGLWAQLRPVLSDQELIELIMLVGHYEMLAMTLNTLRVKPDVLPARRSRVSRVLQGVAGVQRDPRR